MPFDLTIVPQSSVRERQLLAYSVEKLLCESAIAGFAEGLRLI
jgi:hypothetical protein